MSGAGTDPRQRPAAAGRAGHLLRRVLHGDDDPIPPDTARAVADLLDAPFHLLPDCGHVPYVEAFDAFVRILDQALPARR
jgi:pimeloyl-ACP methyl ester carboxylesterase